MRITVFTPAYNRGYIIERLYRSLQNQSFSDFEWIVVDDGSQDNTEELFGRWKNEHNPFPIIYKKVSNGGKHRAVNSGVKMASGDLFYIVDSDDWLPEYALDIIDKTENTIPDEEKKKFCGICGLKGYSDDKMVGGTFDGKEFLDITCLERPKYNISGDRSEVFYTDVIKKYPFPEFDGENFITECVVWDKMAHDGLKFRYFNEITYFCEYLDDGLTAQGMDLFVRNPKGWALFIKQSIEYGTAVSGNRWDCYLPYYSKLRDKIGFKEISENLEVNPATLYVKLFFRRCRHKLFG